MGVPGYRELDVKETGKYKYVLWRVDTPENTVIGLSTYIRNIDTWEFAEGITIHVFKTHAMAIVELFDIPPIAFTLYLDETTKQKLHETRTVEEFKELWRELVAKARH